MPICPILITATSTPHSATAITTLSGTHPPTTAISIVPASSTPPALTSMQTSANAQPDSYGITQRMSAGLTATLNPTLMALI